MDLYHTPQISSEKHLPIAKAIKIVRSPINPSLFAVLSPEEEAHRIVKHPGPFQVVVQNPKKMKMHFIKKQNKKLRRRIIIGNSRGEN